MGNLLAVIVHAANIHDTKSGIEPALFAFERYPSIERFCADAGYRGTFILDEDEILGLGVDISEKSCRMDMAFASANLYMFRHRLLPISS